MPVTASARGAVLPNAWASAKRKGPLSDRPHPLDCGLKPTPNVFWGFRLQHIVCAHYSAHTTKRQQNCSGIVLERGATTDSNCSPVAPEPVAKI